MEYAVLSNPPGDPFDVSGYVRNWRYALKRTREAAAARLAVGILVNIVLAIPLTTELVAPAHAQVIPKSLEQDGTDAALRERRNSWTVGVAGGQLSGTYMTLADELAQVLDDGDNLRVVPIVTWCCLQSRRSAVSAASRRRDGTVGCLRVFPHSEKNP